VGTLCFLGRFLVCDVSTENKRCDEEKLKTI